MAKEIEKFEIKVNSKKIPEPAKVTEPVPQIPSEPIIPINPDLTPLNTFDDSQMNLLPDEETNNSKWIMIFSILVGILLIGAGFTLFRYFSQSEKNIQSTQAPIANVQNSQGSPDETSGITAGVLDYEGITPLTNGSSGLSPGRQTVTPSPTISPTNSQVTKPVVQTNSIINATKEPTSSNGNWVANDYKKGDITTSTYNVKSGDTLWEIAEALYGSGHDWHKIADANHITNLQNGNPLITPGMNLNLPSP